MELFQLLAFCCGCFTFAISAFLGYVLFDAVKAEGLGGQIVGAMVPAIGMGMGAYVALFTMFGGLV